MENKKGSLATVFLVVAIILIAVMGALLYMQKIDADNQIAELENNASKLQETINDLQGKIDTISNTIKGTTEEIKFDVEIEMSELENVNYSNNEQLKTLEDKYKGKTVKITGYVSNFGDDDLEPGRTYVNIGNSTTYENKIYAGGMTYDNAMKAQIAKLEKGQKISIVGVAFKKGTPEESSWPIGLNDIKIIVEKEESNYDEITETVENNDVLSVIDAIKNNNGTYTLKGKIITVDNSKEQIAEYPFYKETGEYKQITISSDTKCVYSIDSNEFKTDTVENVFSKKLYFGGCFNFIFENGKCISVDEIVTGH